MAISKDDIEKAQQKVNEYVKQHGDNANEFLNHLNSFLTTVNYTADKFTKHNDAYNKCVMNGLKNGTVHPSSEQCIDLHSTLSKMPIRGFVIPSFSDKPSSTPRAGK